MVAGVSNKVTVLGGMLDGLRDIMLFLVILWGVSVVNSCLNIA